MMNLTTTTLSLLTLLLSLITPRVESTCFGEPSVEIPDCVCNETCATCGYAALLDEETITSGDWCLTCNGNFTYIPNTWFYEFGESVGTCVGPNVCTFDRLVAQECELDEYCKQTYERYLSPGETFACFGDVTKSMYGEWTHAEECWETADAEESFPYNGTSEFGETGYCGYSVERFDFKGNAPTTYNWTQVFTRPPERQGVFTQTFRSFECDEPEDFFGDTGYCTEKCHEVLSINGLECKEGCTPCPGTDVTLVDCTNVHPLFAYECDGAVHPDAVFAANLIKYVEGVNNNGSTTEPTSMAITRTDSFILVGILVALYCWMV